jgi:phage baseplate assembly protein V
MIDLLLQRGSHTGDLSDPDVAVLRAQLSNLIHRGLVTSVDLAAAAAKVQIGEVYTAALPWLTTRAGGDRTWWAPEVGEHVAVLCPCGSLSQGFILGSLYSGANPAPAASADQCVTKYADGTTITYDRAAHELSIRAVGQLSIHFAGDATVKAKTVAVTAENGLTLNGELVLNGKLTSDLRVAGSIRATGAVVQGVPPAEL